MKLRRLISTPKVTFALFKTNLTVQSPLLVICSETEEKGATEGEMVGRHHRIMDMESEPTLGGGEGQGSLECCSPWGHKESDTTQ